MYGRIKHIGAVHYLEPIMDIQVFSFGDTQDIFCICPECRDLCRLFDHRRPDRNYFSPRLEAEYRFLTHYQDCLRARHLAKMQRKKKEASRMHRVLFAK
jgi:hypothetical protein